MSFVCREHLSNVPALRHCGIPLEERKSARSRLFALSSNDLPSFRLQVSDAGDELG